MNIGGEILRKYGGDPDPPRTPRRGSRLTGFVMALVGALFVAGFAGLAWQSQPVAVVLVALAVISAPLNLFLHDRHGRPVAAWMAWPPLSKVQQGGLAGSWFLARSQYGRGFILIDHWVDVLFDPQTTPLPYEHREEHTPLSRALGVTLFMLYLAAIAMVFRWGWIHLLLASPRSGAGTGGAGSAGGTVTP